jgi:hypothetical protein
MIERMQRDPRPPRLATLAYGVSIGLTVARFVDRESFLLLSTGFLFAGIGLWMFLPQLPPTEP